MADYYVPTSILVIILDIWGIMNVFNSSRDTAAKVLWTLIILVLPIVGFFAWLLVGPREGKL